MAFISNEKREGLIRNVNASYVIKKLVVLVEILALIAFIVITFISLYKSANNAESGWRWFEAGQEIKLTTLGAGMMAYAVILGVIGVVSVILVFTIKSPKTVKKEMKTLESSALSGKRIKKSESAGDIMRERRNPTLVDSVAKKAKAKKRR